SGLTWLFDIDTLTQSMNYQPVVAGNQPTSSAGVQEHFDADKAVEGNVQQYVLFPLWSTKVPRQRNMMTRPKERPKEIVLLSYQQELEICVIILKNFLITSINGVNAASTSVTTVGQNSTNSTNTFSAAGPSNNVVSLKFELGGKSSYVDPSQYPDDPDMRALEDITYSDDEEDVGAEAEFSNLETNITAGPIPTTRVHKDHPVTQIIGHLSLAPQTRSSKWVFKNKKDKRSIVIRNKARLVAQRHTQEEGIDYEEVFAPITRIEAIRLFLAYASFIGLMVYQMDVKNDFLYGTIKEEVYVCQPLGFEDPDYPDKVYKVVKALYSLHQAPRAWYETLANYLLENGFQKINQTLFIKKQKGDILLVQVYVDDIIFGSTNKDFCKAFETLMKDKFQTSSMGELTFFLGLQVKQKQDMIFISQDKYVAEILRKFGLTYGKLASTH
nr:putative ribonuclease H-like domain-containing protein [Tanacetum cinerariifolium]